MRCLAVKIAVFLVATSLFAAADSIDYQGAGTLADHTAFVSGSIAAGHMWEAGSRLIQIDDLTTGVHQTGNLGVIDISTGLLHACPAGFCFTGGTLDIDSLSGKDLFFGTFSSGSITVFGRLTILSAFLSNGAASVIRDNGGSFSSQALVRSHVSAVPEPSTLMLLGTGLLGLASRAKRGKHVAKL